MRELLIEHTFIIILYILVNYSFIYPLMNYRIIIMVSILEVIRSYDCYKSYGSTRGCKEYSNSIRCYTYYSPVRIYCFTTCHECLEYNSIKRTRDWLTSVLYNICIDCGTYCTSCYYERRRNYVHGVRCLECESPLRLKNYTCISECLYQISRCLECAEDINDINNPNSLICIKCPYNYLISQSGKECIPCPSKCKSCSGTETTCECKEGATIDYSPPCTSCLSNLYIYNEHCTQCNVHDHSQCADCEIGYYLALLPIYVIDANLDISFLLSILASLLALNSQYSLKLLFVFVLQILLII